MVITEMGFLFMDQKNYQKLRIICSLRPTTQTYLMENPAWNYNNDGSLLMFGTQYQATKGVKSTLTKII